jgi:hypothetical protein
MTRVPDEALERAARRLILRRGAPAPKSAPSVLIGFFGREAVEEVDRFRKGGPLPATEKGLELLETEVILESRV